VRRALLIAAASVGVAAIPFVTTDRYLLKVLTFVGINVIIIAGLSLLLGYAGQISLGHAAFFGIGAYTSGVLTTGGWPFAAAFLAGVAVAALGGLLLALPSLRLKGHYLAMATLGFGEIMYIFFVEAKGITGGVDGLGSIPPAQIASFAFASPTANFLLVWFFAGLALLLVSNIVGLRPGRALRAMHQSELGAQACGVNLVREKVKVFVISAGLAGLAGVLYAHFMGFISPSSFTLHLSILLVTMVVLGGMGSMVGALAATVLLTLLPYVDAIIPGLPRQVAETLQDFELDIYGLTLILVMLFLPGGLAGALKTLGRRLWPQGAGGKRVVAESEAQ